METATQTHTARGRGRRAPTGDHLALPISATTAPARAGDAGSPGPKRPAPGAAPPPSPCQPRQQDPEPGGLGSVGPRVPAAASPSRGPGPALTWRVVAGAQPHAAADAQVRHGVGQVAGAAAPAQAGVGALVRVERGGQRRGEVQVGEVGERAPRVEGRGDEGDVGRLVRGWEDAGAGGGKRDELSAGAPLPPPTSPRPQPPRAGAAQPRTYWIPGTSQERGRAEDEESCEMGEEE